MWVSHVLQRYVKHIEYRELANYFAVTDTRRGIIYINTKIKHFSNTAKNIVVAHECAHILLRTVSHCYDWEDVFFILVTKLRSVQKNKQQFDEVYIRMLARFPHKKNGKLILKTRGVSNDNNECRGNNIRWG